jgi:predicted aspartyl protease
MGISARFGVALAFCAAFAAPAAAQDCGLKQAASLDMTPWNGRFLVAVTINGAQQPMLLNTGGGITNLAGQALQTLGLHAINDARIKSLDSNGNASQRYVQVQDFAMDRIQAKNIEFMVAPSPNAGADGAFVGSLAADLMSRYDVELDFAARKLNFFLQDHCPGRVLYWNPPIAAEVPIELHRPSSGGDRTVNVRDPIRDIHLWVPVMLDGKPVRAMINTGAANSTLSADVARVDFDVTVDSPGSRPMGSVDGNPDHRMFGHIFSTLTFEGVTVSNPHVVVLPNLTGSKDPNNSLVTGSNIQRIDDNIGAEMTIGMDVLRNLHLYVAFAERKLYITPAANPAKP